MFKIGDRVVCIDSPVTPAGKRGTVSGVPGFPSYDNYGFADANQGMTIMIDGCPHWHWGYQFMFVHEEDYIPQPSREEEELDV